MFNFKKKPGIKSTETTWTFQVGGQSDDDAKLVGFSDQRITFVSTLPQAVSKVAILKAHVRENDVLSAGELRGKILLTASRLLSNRSIEYVGEMQDASREMQALLTMLVRPPESPGRSRASNEISGGEKRKSRRISRHFQVVSKDLQHFKALARDISVEGVKLEADDPVEVDKVMELLLDFDDFKFPQIRCTGIVIWCRPRSKDGHAIGIKFVELSEENRQIIKRYVELITS